MPHLTFLPLNMYYGGNLQFVDFPHIQNTKCSLLKKVGYNLCMID